MITSTWLRNWKRSLERRWTLHQALRRKPISRRLATLPRLEALEDRLLLSPYVVTSTLDDGSVGTLRDAIKQVNLGKNDEIDFRIGTPGSAQTINITSQLPVVKVNNVFINGINTTGGNTQNTVTLNGSGAGAGVSGLILEGTGCTVSGLTIENFSSHGINVFSGSNDSIGGTTTGARNVLSGNSTDGIFIAQGVSGVTVQGDYIGTDATGNAALGNGRNGISAWGSSAMIGGTAVGAGNIISGDGLNGVEIRYSSGNQVLGNTIGANAAGNAPLGNKDNGVFDDSSNNIIGGTAVGAGNVISGNAKNGVWIYNSGSGTQIPFNYIGTNKDGSAALANGGSGILVNGSNNTVGGTTAAAGNVISGNGFNGVWIQTGSGNQVLGNYIGANFDGNAALGNAFDGIRVDSNNNTVGGTTSDAGNIISGNPGQGVLIFGGSNQVLANYIGANYNGTATLPNGIGIRVAGSNNTIGSTASGAGNLISGNSTDGLRIDSGATGTKVLGNTIGANFDTSAALGNSIGIDVLGSNNTIGVGFFSGNNVISGNNTGVLIANGVTGVQVLGGLIGTNAGQTAALGNGIGIDVAGSNNTIGGTASGARNTIAANTTDGMKIESGASGNVVAGNFIGTNNSGTTALGNNIGIEVAGTSNTFGSAGAGNVISGNLKYGMVIDSVSSGNQLIGNFIGINAAGTGKLANGLGINVLGVNNTIGGVSKGNIISGNSNEGVLIVGSGNQVLGNFIGTNAAGTAALGNSIGVHVVNGLNTIGGTASGSGNIISGNSSNGVQIDSGADANQVVNNTIGLNVSGAALSNGGYGVSIASSNNTIGASVSAAGNTIANNKSGGVQVSAGSGNTIRLNSIFANGSTNTGPGITLSSGANNNLAAPKLTSATLLSGKLTVTGTFTATVGVTYTLDFYANPTGDAEGKILLASQVVKAGSVTQAFNFTFPTTATTANPIITATVTDASGDTSAFSPGIHDPILSSLPASNPLASVAPTSNSLPTSSASNSSPIAPASNSVPATPPLPTPLEVALDTAALLLQGDAMALFELNSFATMFLGHSLPPSSQLLSTVLSELGAPGGAGLLGLQLGVSIADSLEGAMT